MNRRRAAMVGCKWGGPMLALAIAWLWWWSATTAITHMGPRDWVQGIASGGIEILYAAGSWKDVEQVTGGSHPTGFVVLSGGSWHVEWWFDFEPSQSKAYAAMPLWVLFLLAVSTSAIAWKIDLAARRRALIGHCAACNYDRLGLPLSSPCPECGATAVHAPKV